MSHFPDFCFSLNRISCNNNRISCPVRPVDDKISHAAVFFQSGESLNHMNLINAGLPGIRPRPAQNLLFPFYRQLMSPCIFKDFQPVRIYFIEVLHTY